MDITAVLVVTTFFGAIVVIWGSFLFTRHRERVMMLEKGLSAEDIKSLYELPRKTSESLSSLKWALFLIGVGLAIMIGLWAEATYQAEGGIYPALIALFGGIGLLVFYFVAKGHQKTGV